MSEPYSENMEKVRKSIMKKVNIGTQHVPSTPKIDFHKTRVSFGGNQINEYVRASVSGNSEPSDIDFSRHETSNDTLELMGTFGVEKFTDTSMLQAGDDENITRCMITVPIIPLNDSVSTKGRSIVRKESASKNIALLPPVTPEPRRRRSLRESLLLKKMLNFDNDGESDGEPDHDVMSQTNATMFEKSCITVNNDTVVGEKTIVETEYFADITKNVDTGLYALLGKAAPEEPFDYENSLEKFTSFVESPVELTNEDINSMRNEYLTTFKDQIQVDSSTPNTVKSKLRKELMKTRESICLAKFRQKKNSQNDSTTGIQREPDTLPLINLSSSLLTLTAAVDRSTIQESAPKSPALEQSASKSRPLEQSASKSPVQIRKIDQMSQTCFSRPGSSVLEYEKDANLTDNTFTMSTRSQTRKRLRDNSAMPAMPIPTINNSLNVEKDSSKHARTSERLLKTRRSGSPKTRLKTPLLPVTPQMETSISDSTLHMPDMSWESNQSSLMNNILHDVSGVFPNPITVDYAESKLVTEQQDISFDYQQVLDDMEPTITTKTKFRIPEDREINQKNDEFVAFLGLIKNICDKDEEVSFKHALIDENNSKSTDLVDIAIYNVITRPNVVLHNTFVEQLQKYTNRNRLTEIEYHQIAKFNEEMVQNINLENLFRIAGLKAETIYAKELLKMQRVKPGRNKTLEDLAAGVRKILYVDRSNLEEITEENKKYRNQIEAIKANRVTLKKRQKIFNDLQAKVKVMEEKLSTKKSEDEHLKKLAEENMFAIKGDTYYLLNNLILYNTKTKEFSFNDTSKNIPFWIYHLRVQHSTRHLMGHVISRLLSSASDDELMVKISKLNAFWKTVHNIVRAYHVTTTSNLDCTAVIDLTDNGFKMTSVIPFSNYLNMAKLAWTFAIKDMQIYLENVSVERTKYSTTKPLEAVMRELDTTSNDCFQTCLRKIKEL